MIDIISVATVGFADVMSKVLYIVYALLILMFMITIHELGHYLVGKRLGFKINEFAIGMGPKIFRRVNKKTGEIFSIRCIPLGGFCAFEGEDEDQDNPQAFNNQKPYKRLLVLFSGAFFNFISAVLISIIAFSCFGENVIQIQEIETFSPNYAQENTIKEGDILLEIDGEKIYLVSDLSSMIAQGDDTMTVKVFRPYDPAKVTSFASDEQGEVVTVTNVKKTTFTPEEHGVESERSGWGVTISGNQGGRVKYSFFDSLGRSFAYCGKVGTVVLKTLGQLITGVVGLDQVGGPITTIDLTSQIAATGFANVLYLITLISVNLAVFNLLPVPALDGCRMIFVIIEWIRGKPVKRNIEAVIHFVGIILLFAFVIVIDLLNLF